MKVIHDLATNSTFHLAIDAAALASTVKEVEVDCKPVKGSLFAPSKRVVVIDMSKSKGCEKDAESVMDDVATIFKLINKTDFMSKIKLMAAVTDVAAKFKTVKSECQNNYGDLLKAGLFEYVKNVDVEDPSKCETSAEAIFPLLKSLVEDVKIKAG